MGLSCFKSRKEVRPKAMPQKVCVYRTWPRDFPSSSGCKYQNMKVTDEDLKTARRIYSNLKGGTNQPIMENIQPLVKNIFVATTNVRHLTHCCDEIDLNEISRNQRIFDYHISSLYILGSAFNNNKPSQRIKKKEIVEVEEDDIELQAAKGFDHQHFMEKYSMTLLDTLPKNKGEELITLDKSDDDDDTNNGATPMLAE